MLAENKVAETPFRPPVCPNCGNEMCLAVPDEFFATFAYYCDECGMRTRECDSPEEAHATIRCKPLEQIKWERDMAMEQLEEHGIPFGGINRPLTYDEALAYGERIENPPLWIEDREFEDNCGWDADEVVQYWLDCADSYTYGKKWRCWTHMPTDEEANDAKWED